MGQKVNPIGLRLILNKKWQSKWYANKKEFGSFLQEDLKIRSYLEKKLKKCAVAKIQIERPAKKAQVTIYSARPGLIIGKSGSEVDSLKKELNKLVGHEVSVNVFEIKRPALVSSLVGESIAQQIEKKVNYRS